MTVLGNDSPEAAGMHPEQVARARDLCAGWVKEGHTHALAVCVARRGKIVLHEAFGRVTPAADSPALETSSLWPLSSGSKPFAATLVMQLVDEGLLGLNRPARDYLPELSGDRTEEILVHHLLTHTSGYVFHTDPPLADHVIRKLQEGFDPPPCPETQNLLIHQMLSVFWDAPLACRPGEMMIYSNHNYELLGEIVRRVSGRSLWDLARERIFDPLGLDDSWYVLPESESARVVQRPPDAPLGGDEGPLMRGLGSRQWNETPFAGGGILSTPRDVTVFGQMFLNRGSYGGARILSQASVAAMTRDQIPGVRARFVFVDVPIASWGYGWGVESPAKWKYFHGSLMSLGTFSHGGAGGFKVWVDRDRELVGVYVEACLRGDPETGEQFWNADLFENAITAAVVD